MCIGGRALAEAVEAAVPGVPLTASFTQAPAAHDGSNGFDLHMEFSHEPETLSATARCGMRCSTSRAGALSGCGVASPGNNRQWGITVVARTVRRRGDAGRARDHRLRRRRTPCATPRGGSSRGTCASRCRVRHRSLPVVSIAASATPVSGRHGGGVHALAHGGDGCRADGDGVGLGDWSCGERDGADVGDVRRGLGQRDAERGDGGRRGSGGREHGDGDGVVGLGLHGGRGTSGSAEWWWRTTTRRRW